MPVQAPADGINRLERNAKTPTVYATLTNLLLIIWVILLITVNLVQLRVNGDQIPSRNSRGTTPLFKNRIRLFLGSLLLAIKEESENALRADLYHV